MCILMYIYAASTCTSSTYRTWATQHSADDLKATDYFNNFIPKHHEKT